MKPLSPENGGRGFLLSKGRTRRAPRAFSLPRRARSSRAATRVQVSTACKAFFYHEGHEDGTKRTKNRRVKSGPEPRRECTALSFAPALRLGRYFGIEPEFWMNLQIHYDLEVQSLCRRNCSGLKARFSPSISREEGHFASTRYTARAVPTIASNSPNSDRSVLPGRVLRRPKLGRKKQMQLSGALSSFN